MPKRRPGSSLNDPSNATSKGKVKLTPSRVQPKDTVHVKTNKGYPIVAKKGSAYAKQGSVVNNLRPGKNTDSYTADTDPLSAKNYPKRRAMATTPNPKKGPSVRGTGKKRK